METLKTIALVLDLICAAILIVMIMFQSSKTAGLSGAIAGASDSFMSKGGSKTLEAKLEKATRVVGLAFVLLSLLTVMLVSSKANASTATQSNDTGVVTTTEAAQ